MEITTIEWSNNANFKFDVNLGTANRLYTLESQYNVRDDGCYITLIDDFTNDIIVKNLKLILNINILRLANSLYKPDAIIFPFSKKVEKITYDAMINGDVKLTQITNYQ